MGAAKKRVSEILDIAREHDRTARICNMLLMTLIVLNVAAVIAESVKTVQVNIGGYLTVFETVSVIIFTVEYILRVWSVTARQKFASPVTGRIRYLFTPMALIDLAAILPFYLPLVVDLDLRFLWALRMLRLFRVLKIGRYSRSLNMLIDVFRRKTPELMISLTVLLLMLIFSSGLIYYFENEVQPEAFSSIPAAMWWGVSALATVGYGDIYPVTVAGKIFGACVAIVGIGIFALPAGILASGLVEEIHLRDGGNNTTIRCPHCKKKIDLEKIGGAAKKD